MGLHFVNKAGSGKADARVSLTACFMTGRQETCPNSPGLPACLDTPDGERPYRAPQPVASTWGPIVSEQHVPQEWSAYAHRSPKQHVYGDATSDEFTIRGRGATA